MAAAWGLGCAAQPAQFPTLPKPPSPPLEVSSDPVNSPPLTLVAQAHHLRADAVRSLLLALSLGDERAVAGLLDRDGQLMREQQNVPLTAHALLNELESRGSPQNTLVSEPGLVLKGRVVGSEGGSGLIVEVEGSPTVRGNWTVVFSDSPVNRIKELRLPPRTT